MGIKQLSKLIREKAPNSILHRKPAYYSSYRIAIDASLAMYQFLIAVRSEGSNLAFEDEATSHLIGMFYRTARMIESGIIPVYVFDGKAPEKKMHELQKRLERREKAEQMMQDAEDKLSIEKYEKRRVKVTAVHAAECQRLLRLMGVPMVIAPSEAEAYCAFLCRSGCVKAVATEDMDALCFGTPILLRHMNASRAKKMDIEEYVLSSILKELDLSMDSFIDLCILLGCDYCETIRNIGPKRAYNFIKKHGSIENVLRNEALEVGDNFDYQGAREIFKTLAAEGEEVTQSIDYDAIDVDEIIKFLCVEKGFDETRVKSTVARILATKKKGTQRRLDSFFRAIRN